MESSTNSDQQQQQQLPPQSSRKQWLAIKYPSLMIPPHAIENNFPNEPTTYHKVVQILEESRGSDDNKTIWIGDLHYWMDENYLYNCFFHTGRVTSIKVIRNKQTGQSEGYGFVEFHSHSIAEKVLQDYNGSLMPNTEQPFRMNWASFSMGDRRSDVNSDHSIFVGDLASDVTDAMLQETFSSRYPSVKGAKVVMDANTGRSKGYGFVRFGDDNERSKAMTEMNGVFCSSRAMRIGAATPRKTSTFQQGYQSPGGYYSYGYSSASPHGYQPDGDLSNTTIFVGGLDPNATDPDLRQAFSQFGEIISIKIPVGKGCGFVQFTNRNNAEDALQRLNGTVIGKQTVRLSWGRNPTNKQARLDYSNQWNGPYYAATPFYGGYGYVMPPPDPNIYGAYGAYPFYGIHQQVS